MKTISKNFQIPASWSELSDKQLRKVYELIVADYDADEIKTLCLLQWTGTKVIGRQDNGAYLLKKGKILFEVTPLTLAELLPHLAWLGSIPTMPVRISKINRQQALPADFSEVPFETFIICDNLYQGYIQTQDDNLLDITDNTDPLYIVKGNSSLRPALSHNVELTLGILEELMHSDTWATVRLGYRQTDRAIARSAAYDATTGVTTYRPVNVRGNRSADATVSAGYYLDRPHNLMLTTTTEAEYVNSVDMIAALRSTVRTATLAERLKLEWKIMDGLSVDAVGNVRWRHSSSPQAGFATLNALDVDYGLILRATRLPWDMSFTTDLMMHTRRGYADSRLNDDRLVWNARLAKSILRGNLTFAIDGFDILGRLSNVVYDVNAQGRTETRYNTLPRYAMLHVIYRLNIQPKKR